MTINKTARKSKKTDTVKHRKPASERKVGLPISMYPHERKALQQLAKKLDKSIAALLAPAIGKLIAQC